MILAILTRLTAWLGTTWLCAAVTSHAWIVPAIQTIHILSVAIVLSGVVLINLRIVGWLERGQPVGAVLARFLWPVTIAVVVLAITGILLIAGEPTRAVFRTIFWLKMAMIVIALTLTWTHRWTIGSYDPAGTIAWGHKLTALIALALWLAVIVAGRWIAYVDAWPGAPS